MAKYKTPEALTFSGVVDVINETTGRQAKVQFVSPEFIRLKAVDEGGKPDAFFRLVLSWYGAIAMLR